MTSVMLTTLPDGKVRIDYIERKHTLFGKRLIIRYSNYAGNIMEAIQLLNVVYGGQTIIKQSA